MTTESGSSDGGGLGCLWTIFVFVTIWAVCFGVTIDGHHYGIDLSCAKGVEVQR